MVIIIMMIMIIITMGVGLDCLAALTTPI